jgi:hypothetical protein
MTHKYDRMEECAAFESEQTSLVGDQGDIFPVLVERLNHKTINNRAGNALESKAARNKERHKTVVGKNGWPDHSSSDHHWNVRDRGLFTEGRSCEYRQSKWIWMVGAGRDHARKRRLYHHVSGCGGDQKRPVSGIGAPEQLNWYCRPLTASSRIYVCTAKCRFLKQHLSKVHMMVDVVAM